MALAAATAFEARSAGWSVRALVVDHGLQDGSAAVASQVVERLERLGLAASSARVEVAPTGGPEGAARAARYAALDRAAGADDAVVVLGHTRDDQAETVLLGLARGSGTRSLAGIAPVHGRYRRPLLGLGRATTARACEAEGIEVWHDPHNGDDRFARVRVRGDVLPVIEAALGPGVVEALARTATAARHDSDALDALADDLAAKLRSPDGGLSVSGLGEALPALRRRVLRQAALDAGAPAGELFAVHVDAMEQLVTGWHGQGPLNLPGDVAAWRADRLLRCARRRHT